MRRKRTSTTTSRSPTSSGPDLPDPGSGFGWEWHRNGVEAFPVLRPSSAVDAIFTTRLGGVCGPPLDSLNISFRAQAEHGRQPQGRWRVFANRSIASRALGKGQRPWDDIRQVHGAEVVEAGVRERPEADAIWTDDPRRTLAVASADCVLLLLVGPGAIAVVHAGWRGMLAGVVEGAANTVGADSAFIGPAIGPCCFEVGRDVSRPFAARFSAEAVPDERHVDLWRSAEEAARDAGVREVSVCRICTSCHPELFFSHRRDAGRTGRQGLLAAHG